MFAKKQESFLNSLTTNLKTNSKSLCNTQAKFQFSEFKCSSCYRNLESNPKFICIICPLTKLCESCEPHHLHPMIKLKKNDFSTISDAKSLLFNGLNCQNNDHKSTSKLAYLRNGFLKAKLELISEDANPNSNINQSISFLPIPTTTKITVCQNQKFLLKFKITNISNYELPSSTTLFAKNNHDLTIDTFYLPCILNKDSYMTIEKICYSSNQLHNYKVEFFLYESKTKIDCNSIFVEIVVRSDYEEENLNSIFFEYPDIQMLSKQKKLLINKLLINKVVSTPKKAFEYLKERNWVYGGKVVKKY